MSPDSHDEHLAQLFAELTEQYRKGQRLNLDAVCREHPDLAKELKSLWPAIMIAEEVARPVSLPPTLDSRPPQPPAELMQAPLRPFGDYELLEELGRGGMGVVYKAWQRSLGRIVAIKMILRGEHAAPADLARFRAEAAAAAKLDHPNIVPVHDIGEVDGQPYFTMKFIEGVTLADRVSQGPLEPREAARIMCAVAHGVHAAHQSGLLHRDLKPSNILLEKVSGGVVSGEDAGKSDHSPLTTHYSPRITDFGLAKRVDGGPSLTNTGAILGTPSYMPPEQAAPPRPPLAKGGLGPQSDVYSLGAVLYHLLTGRPPFQAASSVDTLMLVLEQEPVPPRLLNPRVPRELEMICLKCLQKPMDLRYQTAAQLAEDLQAYLNNEPISASPRSLAYLMNRILRATHHATVLENWGLLWMWHSLMTFLLCLTTALMHWNEVKNPLWYLLLWGAGVFAWGMIFLGLRRRGGPVTFVERQIVHAWAGGVSATVTVFLVEVLLGYDVLTLSPMIPVIAGMVWLIKAGTLSGAFYVSAGAMYATAVLMAALGENPVTRSFSIVLFGAVSAICFFVPGLKYYRQRLRGASRHG
jgi:serine/threonine-protein kinase